MSYLIFQHCKNKLLIFILLIFSVLSELVGISLVYPFIIIFFELEMENIAIFNFVFKYLDNFNISLTNSNLLGLILIFFIFNAFFLLIYRYFITINGLNFMSYIRKKIYFKTFESKYKNSSENISRIYNSITLQSMESGNAMMLQFQIFESILSLMVLLFLSILISIKITILSFLIGIAFFLSLSFTISISKKYGEERFQFNENLYKNLNIAFQNIRYLKAINGFNNFFLKVKPTLNNIVRTNLKFTMLSKGTKILNEPLVLICLSLILYISIKYFDSDTGVIIVILAILRRLYAKVVSTITSLQQYNLAVVSFKYCMDLINEFTNSKEINSKIVFKNFENNLSIKNLSYNNSQTLLYEKTSIKIEKNKTTLILGKSGTGKSTFLNIVLGLIEINKGQVYYDDIDISLYDKNTIRDSIGFVNQEPVIFNLSIRENLKIRNRSISDLTINNFLIDFSLTTIFADKKINLDYMIDEKSSNLSGGEKQRIAIIREIIHKPKILILDEPTSSLDYDNKKIIVDYLKKIKNNTTIIIVSHEDEYIDIADNIYELKDRKFIKNK